MASFDGNAETKPETSPSLSFSMTTSFTDLLTSAGPKPDCGGRRWVGSGVPKFKSIPPPSLPLCPPSSYFAIPPGLSPTELLDSPVLFSSSNILPSPTTGTFPGQALNWKNNLMNNQQVTKQEDSEFSFQTQPINRTSSSTITAQEWVYERSSNQDAVKSEFINTKNSGNSQSNNCKNYLQQTQSYGKKSDDGYNWRKYGQKCVKGSENPRSYYKCSYPNCPTKKKVEMSLDGQITEIVYKSSHNHPKPASTRRSSSWLSSSAMVSCNARQRSDVTSELYDQSKVDSENSSVSICDDDFHQSSRRSVHGGDEFDEDKPNPKRWKREDGSEGILATGSSTVREPRVVVQTTSDIDILDDGFRWRKYGQKVVKGNQNPRSYYKCTHPGCPVRKHVERASHDPRAVITTYEGKHNHDVPAARGGRNSSRFSNNPLYKNNDYNINHNDYDNINHNNDNDTNYNDNNYADLGFSGFVKSYEDSSQEADNAVFNRAEEEPRDGIVQFLESLLE